MSTTRLLVLLTVIAVVLAACGGEEAGSPAQDLDRAESEDSDNGASEDDTSIDDLTMEELIEAAQNEGSLTLYHATGLDTTVAYVQAFTEKYNIPVFHYRAGTGPLHDRWMSEVAAGQHNPDAVVLNDSFLLDDAIDRGLIAEYHVEEAEHFADELKREGFYYPLHTIAMGIAWNPENVTEEEIEMIKAEGFDALRDPIWDGRYVTSPPHVGGTNQIWWYTLMRAEGDRYGCEYLQDLAAHGPDIFDSSLPLFDRLVAGEYDVTDIATETVAGGQYLSGAPVQWMYPDPTPVTVSYMVVTENAPNPHAARLFQEWAMSVEGQENWMTVVQTAPAHDQASDVRQVTDEPWFTPAENLYTGWMDDADFFDPEKRQELYDEWDECWGR